MDDLRGKVAVITGAGSGFGREFARHGHALGMALVLADVQADALEATAQELRAAGANVLAARVDVADRAQVFDLAARTYKTFGKANVLFNNAGVGSGGYLWESTARDWQWVMGVNMMGVVHGIQAFVPRMLAAEAGGEPGHIVNTASMAGWLSPSLMSIYSASKHAVVAMSESLHHDLRLAGSSIGVSMLAPAYVPTGIAESGRNRPATLANDEPVTDSGRMARERATQAVASGSMTAADIARLTFEAVRAGRFYIFTHPYSELALRARVEAAASGGTPFDPVAAQRGAP